MPDKKKRLLSQHSLDVLARPRSYVDTGPKPTNPVPDFTYPPIGVSNQPARESVLSAVLPPIRPRTALIPTTSEESGQPGYVSAKNIGSYAPSSQPLKGDTKQEGRAFSDTEFEGLFQIATGAARSGQPFPSGAMRFVAEIDKGVDANGKVAYVPTGRQVLSPESQQLYQAYLDAQDTMASERDAQSKGQQSRQSFLSELLRNPGALAAFSLMGGGGFGGGFGLPQGQLPQDPYGTNQKFGFNPYQNPTAITSGYRSADTGTALTPQQLSLVRGSNNGQGFDQLMQSGALQRSTLPAGSPIGGFFSGAVPNLGQLGTNPDAAQALATMLALFGINPQQLQQASAQATPRSVVGAGPRARIALPGGSRR